MSMEKRERERVDRSFGHARAEREERERRSQSGRTEALGRARATEIEEVIEESPSAREKIVVTVRRGIQAGVWT